VSGGRLAPSLRAAVAATLLLLTVVHTWPLASAPHRFSRNDNGDCQLNQWIVAWIAHQLPRDPLRLFDANIFHPEPRTLAFSEPLLVPALAGAPLRALGASTLLTYNLLLLAGFFLTALAGFFVAWRFTGDVAAGLLGGSLLAFNAQSLTRLPHLQAHHLEWLPLALFLLDRLLQEPRRRDALLLGISVALLALTTGYGAALAVAGLGAAFLSRAPEAWRQRRALFPELGLAVLVAALLAIPPLLPYWRAHREQGLTRTLDEAQSFASVPTSYLATPARLHYAAWSQRFFGERGGAYFPGVVGLSLSGAALLAGFGAARPRMLAAVAAAGFLLSLGPQTPAYRLLRAVFPPMQGLRDPSRFGQLVILAIALLAPIGLAALRSRLRPRAGSAVAAAAIVLANLEALCAPLPLVPFEGFSPVYRRLAAAEGAVLVEFPLYPPAEIYRNAEYVLASTEHWRPLVNGYSGFTPPAFAARAESLRRFPEDASFAEMGRLGVTHFVVHAARYREPRRDEIAARLDARGDCERLLTGPSGETLYLWKRGS